MPTILIDSSIALCLLYIFLLSTKHIVRGRGTTRTLGLVGMFLFIPSITVIRWFKQWDTSASALPGDSPWWVVSVGGGGAQAPVNLDLVTLALVFSLLYFIGTALVGILIAWNTRVRGGQFQDLHRGLILWLFVTAGLLVYCKFIGFSLTPLLFGMGAVSIVVGLAIQDPLANFFAGLALDIEGFIRPGDWVRVDTEGGTIGQVVEKGWRTTRLLTLDRELVTLPNRVMGGQKILNYHLPETYHAHRLKIGASYDDPPMKVKEILISLLLENAQVLAVPKPLVRTVSFDDSAIVYEMLFFLEDFSCSPAVKDELLTRIWYEFKRHGVQIPFPTRTVQLKDGPQLMAEKDIQDRQHDRLADFLRSLPQFSRYLLPADLEFLSLNATEVDCAPEELIFRKGTLGNSIYLVQSGWCEVTLPGGLRKRLMPGEYFGEMAMLTGQPRSADIWAGAQGAKLVCLGREPLLVIFDKYPRLLAEFDETREARSKESKALVSPLLEQRQSVVKKIGKVLREHFIPW